MRGRMLIKNPPLEIREIFMTGKGVVVGPYTDEWELLFLALLQYVTL